VAEEIAAGSTQVVIPDIVTRSAAVSDADETLADHPPLVSVGSSTGPRRQTVKSLSPEGGGGTSARNFTFNEVS
jgi:hypothetical protein